MERKKLCAITWLQTFRKYSNETLSNKNSRKSFTCLDSQNPEWKNEIISFKLLIFFYKMRRFVFHTNNFFLWYVLFMNTCFMFYFFQQKLHSCRYSWYHALNLTRSARFFTIRHRCIQIRISLQPWGVWPWNHLL